MIRRAGKVGDILKLTVPVEASGVLRTLRSNIRLDIMIERVTEGQVVLVIEEPRMERVA